MSKMHIRVFLKSGAEFTVICDKFTIEKDAFGSITGYEINGITENKPVFIDFAQVAAIIRVYSNENKEDKDA